MNIDKRDAIIELDPQEVDVFTGKTRATADMLRDKHHPAGSYPSFRDKVEHVASELHYETDRTVLICDADSGETLATYDERGLAPEPGGDQGNRH